MKIVVLRLGHRYVRDDRTTTHLFLAARAFGADGVVYTGQRDREIEVSIREVTETWGGPFEVEYRKDGIGLLEEWREGGGEVIHLTMYGLLIQSVIDNIRSSSADKLVVVGGAKVPKVVYETADWNVAVTPQPHSEVSALSVFLHELFEGGELSKPFENAKLEIVPQAKGKKVVKRSVG